jgi:hypothetical protein
MGGKRIVKAAPVRAPAAPERTGSGVLLLVLVIAMAVGGLYLLIKGPVEFSDADSGPKQKADETMTDSGKTDEATEVTDMARLIASVGRHILINVDETPFVATISNIDLVRQKNPVFYKDAEQGDKVLIWSDKAVIYSPTQDKLIAVMTAYAPVPGDDITTSTAGVEEEATIEIRNGSRIAGAAGRLRTKLIEAGVDVIRIGDTRASTGVLVIDQTGGNAPKALDIVLEIASGTLGILPAGEAPSDADILVIIGL